MAGESGGVGSGDDSATSSPKSKVKIFCSYGGKILPRTSDGVLKYVGGESRVIGVSRDITLSEFMKKVSPLTGNDMIFKYQLVPEDLDNLVTVRSDADLQHMFDEHDRLGNGATMLRAFLFPSKPIVLENQSFVSEPHILEQQRYVDAINGILHICSPRGKPVTVVSSVCSSPKNSNSPDAYSAPVTPDSLFFINNSSSSMHRVHSSPSFSSLTNFQGSLNSPKYQNSCYHHHHHHPPYGNPFVRRSPDPPAGFGFGRPQPVLSLPRQDSGRCSGFNMPYSPTRSNGNKCGSGLPSPSSGQHLRFDTSNSSPRALNPNPMWE